MPRYIDADKLKESFMAGAINSQDTFPVECICNAIDETDTADVAEVVRCKDCKYRYADECTIAHEKWLKGEQ